MSSEALTSLDSLSAPDKELLVDALAALLRERGVALKIARRTAASKGHRQPEVGDFGLPDILRLSRLFVDANFDAPDFRG
jgi:hypothetical protein